MVQRREFLIGVGTSIALAGCTGGTDSDANNQVDDTETDTATAEPTDTPTKEPTPTRTEEDTDTPTEEPTEEPTEVSESVYQVRISYDGEWSGTVGGDGSTRSVDGSGTQTFDIDGEPLIVSANAQKQDDGSGELTVEILEDGDVIAEESTTAEYGVAQVTSEDDTGSSGSSDSGGSSGSESTFEVRIDYNGDWQGSISAGGTARSVDGSGTETIEIDGEPDILSANAQKQDSSSDELVIQIVKDGEVVEETSTTAEYGVAQVSYSDY